MKRERSPWFNFFPAILYLVKDSSCWPECSCWKIVSFFIPRPGLFKPFFPRHRVFTQLFKKTECQVLRKKIGMSRNRTHDFSVTKPTMFTTAMAGPRTGNRLFRSRTWQPRNWNVSPDELHPEPRRPLQRVEHLTVGRDSRIWVLGATGIFKISVYQAA